VGIIVRLAFAGGATQFGEGAEEAALSGFAAAEDAVERLASGGVLAVDNSERVLRGKRTGRARSGVLFELKAEELGLNAREAATVPIGLDQGVDEVSFEGTVGLELLIIFADELFELDGIFAGDDE
jgi:hypothetical protein